MKYNNSWHLLQNEDVLQALSTDMYKGLTTEEAKRRRAKNGENSIWRVKRASAGEIALATLFDLATLLLIVSAAAAAFFDKSYEAGAIVAILVIGALLRTAAYVRANRILEGIAKEKIPVSSVIRDGRIKVLTAGEIVVGDVIFLEQGDTVPCDGRVVSGEDSVVSEGGITENKTPVHKFNTVIKTEAKSGDVPCEFRSNMMFAGSVVLSGAVRIVATACGDDTLISMKRGGIDIDPVDKLPIVEKLKNRSRNTSLILLACAMVLTTLSLFLQNSAPLSEVFLGTMAMAAAAMSEFLTTIGYIVVAVAVRDTAIGKTAYSRELKKKIDSDVSRAILREPSKIEEIASPDVMIFCGSNYFRSGRSELIAFRNKFGYTDQRAASVDIRANPDELLTLALSATVGVSLGLTTGSEVRKPTENANIVFSAADAYSKIVNKPIKYSYSPIDHSDSSWEHSGGLDTSTILMGEELWAVSCGAIDSVLRCCSTYETVEGSETITPEFTHKVYTEVANLEFSGARVVAVAKRRTAYTRLDKPALITQYMTFVGFLAVAHEQEKEGATTATNAFEYLRSNGVCPILFTETPESDLYYCHRLGLFNKKTVMVEYKDLATVDAKSLDENGMIVSFARLEDSYLSTAYSRAAKYISKELENEENGRKLSVVGMDVWDSGALKRADVGYAVVRSKYRNIPESLLKNAHAVVDTSNKQSETGFGGLIGVTKAIKAARRVVRNTESAKNYLTLSQTARLIILMSAVVFGIPLLSTVFILLWGLIYDFAAVLVMSFEQGDGKKNEKTRLAVVSSVLCGAVWGGITSALIPLMDIAAKIFGMASEPSTEIELAVMSASVIISGVVLSAEILKRTSIFGSTTLNSAQFFFGVASIAFAAFIMFTGVGSALVGGGLCGIFGLFALLPAAVMLGFCELMKLLRKNKKSKA